MIVDGTETTVVLQGLNPLTQYLVEVYSVVGEESSEPLKGTETTRMSSLLTSELVSFKLQTTTCKNPFMVKDVSGNVN